MLAPMRKRAKASARHAANLLGPILCIPHPPAVLEVFPEKRRLSATFAFFLLLSFPSPVNRFSPQPRFLWTWIVPWISGNNGRMTGGQEGRVRGLLQKQVVHHARTTLMLRRLKIVDVGLPLL